MFSDSDTIFGDLADSNADALWSSTKDSTNIPLNFTPLTGDSNEQSETADHAMLVYPSQSSSAYQKTNDVKYRAPQNVQALVAEGSIHGSHKLMNEGASAKHNGTPDQGFQLKHLSSVQLDPPNEGSIMNYYTGPPVLLSSGYEAPPVNANSSRKSEDAPAKPPSMTPTEKIEKLRKRQQMRAIRAIQKQQLQSNNQASVSGNFSMEGGKVAAVQSISNLPFHETSSVTEQDDPRTANMVMDNCSMVESILYRLQETVVKLDMRIRLSIRDSLFRLARSAMQRKYPNDTNSSCASSRNEACNNKDMIKNKQLSIVTDMETETNPIDRTVAQLLFHVGLSGKPAETSESPSSKSIANERLLDVSESSQMTTSSHGMKSSSTSFYHGMMETETCN